MNEYLAIITTTDSEEEAFRIARQVVEKRIAACAQISGPITSIYHWQGNIEQAKEWRCNIKTRKSLYKDVEKTIIEMHSYDVPQIVGMPITEGSSDYLDWIETETNG